MGASATSRDEIQIKKALLHTFTPLELRVDEGRNLQDVRAVLALIASKHVATELDIAGRIAGTIIASALGTGSGSAKWLGGTSTGALACSSFIRGMESHSISLKAPNLSIKGGGSHSEDFALAACA